MHPSFAEVDEQVIELPAHGNFKAVLRAILIHLAPIPATRSALACLVTGGPAARARTLR
jgi:hypothetical protein